jgi:hypothetical protein
MTIGAIAAIATMIGAIATIAATMTVAATPNAAAAPTAATARNTSVANVHPHPPPTFTVPTFYLKSSPA